MESQKIYSKRKPNIIFITCDTLRADRLGFSGYKKNITPFLDSLAEKGLYFKNAFSVGSDTAQSFVSIFTSTYPTEFGGYSYIEKPRVLVSEILHDEGYKTIAVHSTAFASSYFGYDRGWDEFRYVPPPLNSKNDSGVSLNSQQNQLLKKTSAIRNFFKTKIIFRTIYKLSAFVRKIIADIFDFQPPFLTAEEINEEVKKIISNPQDKPIFLWVHYMDIHTPFALFAQKGKYGWMLKLKYYLSDFANFLLEETPLAKIFNKINLDLYDESIKYVDGQVKKLAEYLSFIDVLNNDSILVVSADHGKEFYEHGMFKVGRSCFNTSVHVPLIFYGPKIVGSGIIEKPVSQIDLAPTFAKIAGGKIPESFKGADIFGKNERAVISQVYYQDTVLSEPVFYGASVIYKGYKLIHLFGKRTFFSLDDTDEKNNLYDKNKGIAEKLEDILKNYEIQNQ